MKTYRYDLIQQDPVPCLRVREELPNHGMMQNPADFKEWVTSVIPFHEYCEEYVYLVATSTKSIPLGVFE